MSHVTGESDIAVIGAGIVDLSTAFVLTEQGASVTIYERVCLRAASPGSAPNATILGGRLHSNPLLGRAPKREP